MFFIAPRRVDVLSYKTRNFFFFFADIYDVRVLVVFDEVIIWMFSHAKECTFRDGEIFQRGRIY